MVQNVQLAVLPAQEQLAFNRVGHGNEHRHKIGMCMLHGRHHRHRAEQVILVRGAKGNGITGFVVKAMVKMLLSSKLHRPSICLRKSDAVRSACFSGELHSRFDAELPPAAASSRPPPCRAHSRSHPR